MCVLCTVCVTITRSTTTCIRCVIVSDYQHSGQSFPTKNHFAFILFSPAQAVEFEFKNEPTKNTIICAYILHIRITYA